ncbi:MAG: sugar transferase [Nitrospina sp.]|nr:sugar transferase [Nitrospina sp.]
MPRWANIILALMLLPLTMIPFIIIAIGIRATSPGPAIHWSTRVGKMNILFKMPKFRTMRLDTPDVPTHLMNEPDKYVTPIGQILRLTSLDELPQLWSILKGDMVFVGPRPALFNQDDLIDLRTNNEVHKLAPGITGWAQIQGRDELPIPKKVEMDVYYLKNRSFWMDSKILFFTLFAVIKIKGVSH